MYLLKNYSYAITSACIYGNVWIIKNSKFLINNVVALRTIRVSTMGYLFVHNIVYYDRTARVWAQIGFYYLCGFVSGSHYSTRSQIKTEYLKYYVYIIIITCARVCRYAHNGNFFTIRTASVIGINFKCRVGISREKKKHKFKW